MAAAVQAESLPPRVEPLVHEAFKASIDGKTILSFVHQCELYYSLVFISNKHMQALFMVRLLQEPTYKWFITQQHILNQNVPAKLDWPKSKSNKKGILNLHIMHINFI